MAEFIEGRKAVPGHTEVLGRAAGNPSQPSEIGFPIVALGQRYTVSPLEQGIKAQFEQWVRGNAVAGLAVLANEPALQQQALALYSHQMAAGVYNWDNEGDEDEVSDGVEGLADMGNAVQGALSGKPGMCHLIYLLLRRCHPKMTKKQSIKIWNDLPANVSKMVMDWALLGNQPSSPVRSENGGGTKSRKGKRRRREGYRFVEVVAEIVYHLHYPLSEIARLTDLQLAEVFFRARDDDGKLVRTGRDGKVAPVAAPVSFEKMFRQAWEKRGYDAAAIDEEWFHYCNFEEPGLGRRLGVKKPDGVGAAKTPAAPGGPLKEKANTAIKLWRPKGKAK